jgi:hypothetical protein
MNQRTIWGVQARRSGREEARDSKPDCWSYASNYGYSPPWSWPTLAEHPVGVVDRNGLASIAARSRICWPSAASSRTPQRRSMAWKRALFSSQSLGSRGKTLRCKSVALGLQVFKGRTDKYPECACCGRHLPCSRELCARGALVWRCLRGRRCSGQTDTAQVKLEHLAYRGASNHLTKP